MSIVYLILLILAISFLICTVVAVVQFLLDLKSCSDLRAELKETIRRIKLQNGIVENNVESEEKQNVKSDT